MRFIQPCWASSSLLSSSSTHGHSNRPTPPPPAPATLAACRDTGDDSLLLRRCVRHPASARQRHRDPDGNGDAPAREPYRDTTAGHDDALAPTRGYANKHTDAVHPPLPDGRSLLNSLRDAQSHPHAHHHPHQYGDPNVHPITGANHASPTAHEHRSAPLPNGNHRSDEHIRRHCDGRRQRRMNAQSRREPGRPARGSNLELTAPPAERA